MATRLTDNSPFGKVGVTAHANGWTAHVNGKDMPLSEIAQKYHAGIRSAVKDMCEVNGWEDMSEL